MQQLYELVNAANVANMNRDYVGSLRLCQEALAISAALPETWYNLGIAQGGLGRRNEAVASFEQARLRTLQSADAQNAIGSQLVDLNEYDLAEKCLKKALSLSPNHALALANVGRIRLLQGHTDEAISLFQRSIDLTPSTAEIYVNLCGAYLKADKFADAETVCRKAIALAPHLPQAWSNLGIALHRQKRFDAAEAAYKEALRLAPNFSEAWTNLGNLQVKQETYESAEESCRKAIALSPQSADAWIGLGVALTEREPHSASEGLECLNKATEIAPESPEAWLHRASALRKLGSVDDAIASLDKALQLRSNYADAHYDKGILLSELGELDSALHNYERAIAIKPDLDDAHLNRGLILLSRGQYCEGWNEFEHRWGTRQNALKRIRTDRPTWNGTASDRTLLLWGEQGIGDQILYASILPELADFPQKKYVALDKRLLPLFKRSMPGFEFIDLEEVSDALDFDEQLPLGSLPRYFRPSLQSFATASHPFLMAESARAAALREKIASDGKLVCGVSWSSINKGIGKMKSISLSQMLVPLASEKLHFVDLQYGNTTEERQALQEANGIAVQHLDEVDNFHDIDGLAALIQACDLVITTSNSTAHLAGALGKETLQLVPAGKGKLWYWVEYDGRNPWYPSIHSFTQTEPGQWKQPLMLLKQRLEHRP